MSTHITCPNCGDWFDPDGHLACQGEHDLCCSEDCAAENDTEFIQRSQRGAE